MSSEARELEIVALETADTVGIIDAMLDKLIGYLNAGKIRKVEKEISAFERKSEELGQKQRETDSKLQALTDKLSQIENDQNFRLSDTKSIGLSWMLRYTYKSFQKDWVSSKKDKCLAIIESTKNRIEKIADKVDELNVKLQKMLEQDNPSLFARALRWLQFVKNVIVGIISAIAGQVTSALSFRAAVLRMGELGA